MLPSWTLLCLCLFLSSGSGQKQPEDVQPSDNDEEEDEMFTVSARGAGFFSGSLPYPVLYRTGRYNGLPAQRISKKALSIFTRWRPTYSLESEPGESAIVSAVSRAQGRPVGQPLRWG